MTAFSGVVSIDQSDIPVVIDVDDHGIRMIAAGTEIGSWAVDEYEISRLGDSRYGITAEEETLFFVPNEPRAFDQVVNGHIPSRAPDTERRGKHVAPAETASQPIGPPPKAVTMVAFYALCAFTAALGVWSLIRIIF